MMYFICAFPFLVGIVMILAGILVIVYQSRGMIHTQGVIADIAKTVKKKSKVQVDLEAPVVVYKIDGVEYRAISHKFFYAGDMNFQKGSRIKIRVSRFDRRRFVPEISGGIAQMLLIWGGISMIAANTVILLRYGR